MLLNLGERAEEWQASAAQRASEHENLGLKPHSGWQWPFDSERYPTPSHWHIQVPMSPDSPRIPPSRRQPSNSPRALAEGPIWRAQAPKEGPRRPQAGRAAPISGCRPGELGGACHWQRPAGRPRAASCISTGGAPPAQWPVKRRTGPLGQEVGSQCQGLKACKADSFAALVLSRHSTRPRETRHQLRTAWNCRFAGG